MIIFLALLALTAAQQCPYCAWNACSSTFNGLANCSACDQGALVPLQTFTLISGHAVSTGEFIGVCQLCPQGCTSCEYTMIDPSMSVAFNAINCSNCVSGYTYNYSSGGCLCLVSHQLCCLRVLPRHLSRRHLPNMQSWL